jgi:hypothetical protein
LPECARLALIQRKIAGAIAPAMPGNLRIYGFPGAREALRLQAGRVCAT